MAVMAMEVFDIRAKMSTKKVGLSIPLAALVVAFWQCLERRGSRRLR